MAARFLLAQGSAYVLIHLGMIAMMQPGYSTDTIPINLSQPPRRCFAS